MIVLHLRPSDNLECNYIAATIVINDGTVWSVCNKCGYGVRELPKPDIVKENNETR